MLARVLTDPGRAAGAPFTVDDVVPRLGRGWLGLLPVFSEREALRDGRFVRAGFLEEVSPGYGKTEPVLRAPVGLLEAATAAGIMPRRKAA